MNLGQTTVRCSPTSPVATGGLNQPGETVTLYQQETERGNEMVRRSWCFSSICVLRVRAYVAVVIFNACRELNSESRLLSGAKMFLRMALPARNPQEQHGCRYSSGNVTDRLYIYREREPCGDMLEPWSDQIHSARWKEGDRMDGKEIVNPPRSM